MKIRTVSLERKLKLAVSKIMGNSDAQAIRNADYANSITKTGQLPDEIKRLVVTYGGLMQKGYVEGLFTEVSPIEMGKIAGRIIKNGSDFDKMNAIKISATIILREADKTSHIMNQNIFILPESSVNQKEIVDTQVIEDQRILDRQGASA